MRRSLNPVTVAVVAAIVAGLAWYFWVVHAYGNRCGGPSSGPAPTGTGRVVLICLAAFVASATAGKPRRKRDAVVIPLFAAALALGAIIGATVLLYFKNNCYV